MGETRKKAKEKADALFASHEEHLEKPATAKVRTANMATEVDLRRWFVLIQGEERDYEKTMAKLRSDKQQAKASLDKIYADAADLLKSRGVTKRILKAMYELSKRDEDEVKTEMSASVWAMRAAGLPIGSQLSFWEDGLADPADAYNKALGQGREAGLRGESSTDNPHNGHHLLQQAWMEGWHAGQAEIIEANNVRQ